MLYDAGIATLLACWEACARGATAGEILRLAGVAVAVFPDEPERSIYNNAVLERALDARARASAVEAMEAAYAAAGIARYAAWVHETDEPLRRELARRGYHVTESTRAMGVALDAVRSHRPPIELGPPDWSTYVRLLGMPQDYQARADPGEFSVLVARLDGEDVATGMAFDHAGDCGIYNVGTLEHARRRGIGTALTAWLLLDARARGCRTASLQATPMAERVYSAVGFRDLGRILEYGPPRG